MLPREWVAVDDLRPHPRNPRKITPARLEALERVLAADPEMLQARPLIALPDGTVVAGNQRHRAATSLRDKGDERFQTVPTVYADLDEDRAIEWALRDNEGFGERDNALTAQLLEELAGRGRNLELTGLTSDAVTRLLADLARSRVHPDAIPKPPSEPASRLGEMYELGPHLLLCGDAFDAEAREGLLDITGIDALITDPPYGINLNTDFKNGRVSGRTYRPVEGDDHEFDAAAIVAWAANIKEQFWFGANYYRRTLSESDRDGSWLVWDKRTESTDVVAGSGFELIWSRAPHKQDLLRVVWTNFTSHYNAGLHREHPTEKPVALLETIIERWVPAAGQVLDLFAGAGSTLIACERTGRQATLIEIDPLYCDIIRQRYADYTGNQKWAA